MSVRFNWRWPHLYTAAASSISSCIKESFFKERVLAGWQTVSIPLVNQRHFVESRRVVSDAPSPFYPFSVYIFSFPSPPYVDWHAHLIWIYWFLENTQTDGDVGGCFHQFSRPPPDPSYIPTCQWWASLLLLLCTQKHLIEYSEEVFELDFLSFSFFFFVYLSRGTNHHSLWLTIPTFVELRRMRSTWTTRLFFSHLLLSRSFVSISNVHIRHRPLIIAV